MNTRCLEPLSVVQVNGFLLPNDPAAPKILRVAGSMAGTSKILGKGMRGNRTE